jgi:hypothetical protein
MAFVAFSRQTFGQIGQMLCGGGVIRPVVLIHEQNPVRPGA